MLKHFISTSGNILNTLKILNRPNSEKLVTFLFQKNDLKNASPTIETNAKEATEATVIDIDE